MTKTQRIGNFFFGIVQIAAAVIFFLDPAEGLEIAASLLGLSFMLQGIQGVIYYLTMARHMVGGKVVLYRGLIFLDLGLFTSTLASNHRFYLVMYLAGINAFTGMVNLLRSREDKAAGSPSWKYQALTGSTGVLAAFAVILGGIFLRSIRIIVYIYAAGLFYKGVVRIVSIFRKTAIVFIQ